MRQQQPETTGLPLLDWIAAQQILERKKLKRCTGCKIAKAKSEFYGDKSRKDGLTDWCKSCQREYRHSRRDILNERARERYAANPEPRRQRDLARYHNRIKTDPALYARRLETNRLAVARWRKKSGAKVRAAYLARYAAKIGELEKPDVCQVKGCRASRIEAHHQDYSKPLAVKWLCPKHHKAAHRGERLALKDATTIQS